MSINQLLQWLKEVLPLLIQILILIVYFLLLRVTNKYSRTTEKLVKVTHEYSKSTEELVKQQEMMAEMNVMPQIHIEFWSPSIAIRILVDRYIAEIIEGKVWLERNETISRKKEMVDVIPPTTAMPWSEHYVNVKLVHIREELESLNIGDEVKVYVDLTYKSILGGQYKSLHWLTLKKNDSGDIGLKNSDMKFIEKPWELV